MAWVLTTKQYRDILAGEIVTRTYRGSFPEGRVEITALDDDMHTWLPDTTVLAIVEHSEKVGSGIVRHHYRFYVMFQRLDP